ncbi:MAG: hypothetical protein EXS14_01520 [Planctomycetes bacterium]|nr:hypothetical protein [Planctomycetota bacterium]
MSAAPDNSESAWPFAILGAAAFVLAMLFMPWNADGCFAVNDALWYAHGAEHDGLASISGHHPLFHVLLLPITLALDAVGVAHPGHWALRIVSGAALAGIVLLLGRLAGWRRAALALPLMLVATRAVLLESAVGETVVPAAALALWALIVAADRGTSMARAGVIATLALLLRQDNILIVPGLLFALGARLPAEARIKQLTLWLLLTGVFTIFGYAVCWKLSGVTELRSFLMSTAETASRTWAPEYWPGLNELVMRSVALGVAVTGVQVDFRAFALNLGIGAAFFAVLLAAAKLARGSIVLHAGLLFGSLLIAATRFCFYLWFEPHNFEWWIVELVLATALCAATMRGTPRTTPFRSRIAILLLIAAATCTFWVHKSTTLALRDTTLHDAAAQAELWSQAPEQPLVVTHGFRTHTALHLRQIHHDPFLLLTAPIAEVAAPLLTEYITRANKPVVLLIDRFVGDGHPAQALTGHDSLSIWIDQVEEVPPLRIWRQRGKAQVLWLPPKPR